MFQPVNPKEDFVALEHRILEFWEREQIFAKLRAQVAGKPAWSFIDGPITANNPMGVHHAWGRTYKDVFQRYWAMRGYDQRWQNGFDCQGLWLEVETERDLGMNGKRDIEKFGLDNFSRACRARVDKYSAVQAQQSIRLGQWMRWDDSYYTMTDLNIEYIWHFLQICHERKWLYLGHRSMPWCTRCGTSLSQHELADGYEDTIDESVYLRFPLHGRDGESLLVWTTTPWTLSSNVAAAVNPELEYARVRYKDHVYYVSTGVLEKIFKKDGEVLGTLKGAEMLGWTYDGPYDEFDVVKPVKHRVIAWDEVSDAEGTGIVHIAPGCGAEDFELSKVHDLAVLAPLDGDGVYRPGYGWQSGKDVHDMEKPVLHDLKEKGIFFRQESYKHRYPYCWRCKHKLVFRIEDEWFIACDEIRPQMKAAAETVTWVPESVGKRTQDWYDNMGDWCISRKRYWGLPLPIYFCGDQHMTLIGSRAELRERAIDPQVVDALPELHRPWIDEVKIRCADCGGEATRIKDVGDCWLDAGIVGFSTLKYFEDRAYWEKWYPSELVCEMREQVRLWFYAMMFTGVTLVGRAPYKTVFAYEKVYDEKGKPMHKSSGNAIWFDDAAEKMGADVMRWLYCAFNPNNNLRFGYKVADEIRRKILTLWNVYSFFVTYATIDRFDPAEVDESGRTVVEATLGQSQNALDRWIISELYRTVREIKRGYEEYDTQFSLRRAESFLDMLSTWYLRRSRRRFWRAEGDMDKTFAYRTLHHTLLTLSTALAPIVPFLSEEVYRNLAAPLRAKGLAPESVHLQPFPLVREDLIDAELNDRMEHLISSVSLGRAAREKVQIKVRQPLRRLWLFSLDRKSHGLDDHFVSEISEELNVKEIVRNGSLEEFVRKDVKLNFPILGAKLGAEMKSVAAAVKAGQWSLDDEGKLAVGGHLLEPGEYELAYEARDGYAAANDRDTLVVLDTEITGELRREGYAREIIRTVQDLRKQADYRVDDRIKILYRCGDARVEQMLREQEAYIQGETLATACVAAPIDPAQAEAVIDRAQEVELDDNLTVWLGVKRRES